MPRLAVSFLHVSFRDYFAAEGLREWCRGPVDRLRKELACRSWPETYPAWRTALGFLVELVEGREVQQLTEAVSGLDPSNVVYLDWLPQLYARDQNAEDRWFPLLSDEHFQKEKMQASHYLKTSLSGDLRLALRRAVGAKDLARTLEFGLLWPWAEAWRFVAGRTALELAEEGDYEAAIPRARGYDVSDVPYILLAIGWLAALKDDLDEAIKAWDALCSLPDDAFKHTAFEQDWTALQVAVHALADLLRLHVITPAKLLGRFLQRLKQKPLDRAEILVDLARKLTDVAANSIRSELVGYATPLIESAEKPDRERAVFLWGELDRADKVEQILGQILGEEASLFTADLFSWSLRQRWRELTKGSLSDSKVVAKIWNIVAQASEQHARAVNVDSWDAVETGIRLARLYDVLGDDERRDVLLQGIGEEVIDDPFYRPDHGSYRFDEDRHGDRPDIAKACNVLAMFVSTARVCGTENLNPPRLLEIAVAWLEKAVEAASTLVQDHGKQVLEDVPDVQPILVGALKAVADLALDVLDDDSQDRRDLPNNQRIEQVLCDTAEFLAHKDSWWDDPYEPYDYDTYSWPFKETYSLLQAAAEFWKKDRTVIAEHLVSCARRLDWAWAVHWNQIEELRRDYPLFWTVHGSWLVPRLENELDSPAGPWRSTEERAAIDEALKLLEWGDRSAAALRFGSALCQLWPSRPGPFHGKCIVRLIGKLRSQRLHKEAETATLALARMVPGAALQTGLPWNDEISQTVLEGLGRSGSALLSGSARLRVALKWCAEGNQEKAIDSCLGIDLSPGPDILNVFRWRRGYAPADLERACELLQRAREKGYQNLESAICGTIWKALRKDAWRTRLERAGISTWAKAVAQIWPGLVEKDRKELRDRLPEATHPDLPLPESQGDWAEIGRASDRALSLTTIASGLDPTAEGFEADFKRLVKDAACEVARVVRAAGRFSRKVSPRKGPAGPATVPLTESDVRYWLSGVCASVVAVDALCAAALRLAPRESRAYRWLDYADRFIGRPGSPWNRVSVLDLQGEWSPLKGYYELMGWRAVLPVGVIRELDASANDALAYHMLPYVDALCEVHLHSKSEVQRTLARARESLKKDLDVAKTPGRSEASEESGSSKAEPTTAPGRTLARLDDTGKADLEAIDAAVDCWIATTSFSREQLTTAVEAVDRVSTSEWAWW